MFPAPRTDSPSCLLSWSRSLTSSRRRRSSLEQNTCFGSIRRKLQRRLPSPLSLLETSPGAALSALEPPGGSQHDSVIQRIATLFMIIRAFCNLLNVAFLSLGFTAPLQAMEKIDGAEMKGENLTASASLEILAQVKFPQNVCEVLKEQLDSWLSWLSWLCWLSWLSWLSCHSWLSWLSWLVGTR